MSHTWYLSIQSQIFGPLSTVQVELKLRHVIQRDKALIWWHGQRDWMPVPDWQEKMQEILASVAAQTQKPIWYVMIKKRKTGPFTQKQLIENLKVIADLAEVEVWVEGMPAPRRVFEVQDVIEQLGVDRREFERTPLNAIIDANRIQGSKRSFQMKAGGVSRGGMGLIGFHDFKVAERLSLMIQCEEFGGKLHIEGEVVYLAANHYTGIRFLNLSAEARTVIYDYVKIFELKQRAEAA